MRATLRRRRGEQDDAPDATEAPRHRRLLGLDPEQEQRLRRIALWGAVGLLAVGLSTLSPINMVRVIVFGLQLGAVYALIALGIALVYKTTRILNFAQGEFGTVAAFVAIAVLLRGDLAGEVEGAPAFVEMLGAALVAIAAAAALGVVVNLLVVERLARASELTALVATVGVMLALVSIQAVVFDIRARRFPRFIQDAPCLGPQTGDAAFGLCPVRIAGTVVTWHTLIVLTVLLTVAAVLAAFFRTRTGIALLATAQEPFAAQLQGVSPRAMATLAWGTAGALGGLGGLLGAGVFQLITPGYITTTWLVAGFTAAVLGGITSMVGAVAGGLLLGVTISLANATVLASDTVASYVPGAPHAATFAVLLLVLLVRPRGLLGKEA